MANMNPVVHFEMPAKDKKRVSEFYAKVFGWEMQQMGEEMGNYLLATTTPTDSETGRPKESGAINGGFWETQKNEPPHVVIAVDDIQKAIDDVKAAGGKVLPGMGKPEEPDNIPGVGLYVTIIDTEENRVGVLQPSPMQNT